MPASTSAPKFVSLLICAIRKRKKKFLSPKCKSARIFLVSFLPDFNFATLQTEVMK